MNLGDDNLNFDDDTRHNSNTQLLLGGDGWDPSRKNTAREDPKRKQTVMRKSTDNNKNLDTEAAIIEEEEADPLVYDPEQGILVKKS
mgnify:FL=1